MKKPETTLKVTGPPAEELLAGFPTAASTQSKCIPSACRILSLLDTRLSEEDQKNYTAHDEQWVGSDGRLVGHWTIIKITRKM